MCMAEFIKIKKALPTKVDVQGVCAQFMFVSARAEQVRDFLKQDNFERK